MAVSFMKKGAASAAVAEQEQAEQEARKAAQGQTWRFFLKEKEEARITFVDGDLVEVPGAGLVLAPPRYYEHNLQINGKWGNTYVCPEKTVPEGGYKCPICEAGDRPSLVALFTIIDHRSFETKKQVTMKDQVRLLVAKPPSMEYLTKIAVKRGGLAGCTLDVSRMGEQSAAIGSMFDFVEKNTIETLQAAFTHEVEINGTKHVVSKFVPIDYEAEIVFREPSELLKLGLGKSVHTGSAASQMSPGGHGAAGGKPYSSQL